MALVEYVRAVGAVSYTVDGVTYTYTDGQLVHNPYSSVTPLTQMSDDDPLILNGLLTLLYSLRFIKTVVDINYPTDGGGYPTAGTSYFYAAGEILRNPTSTVVLNGVMVSDDPLLLSGDVREIIPSDFIPPPEVDPFNSVFQSTNKPAIGKVRGTIYITDWDVVANYFWYVHSQLGPQAVITYHNTSGAHSTETGYG